MIRKILETKYGLFFTLLASVILKLSLCLPGKVINPDATLYLDWARQIALGEIKEVFSQASLPFYSLLIAGLNTAGLDLIWAGRVISILGMTLVLIPLYLMTKEMFSSKAAFWACLASAINPLFNDWALDIIRNPMFVFCLLWSLYFSQRALMDGKISQFLLATAFALLSVMFRIEGILIFPCFALFLAAVAIFKSGELRRHSMKGLIVWVGLPTILALACLPLFGTQFLSATRLDQVIDWWLKLTSGGFFDRYTQIYESLRSLEESSYFPGGKQNFAEIARHHMPLIYFMGVLRAFIKVFFPFFIIPLLWGLRHSWNIRHVWVLTFAIAYIGLIYLSLLKRDFLEYRFLLAPVLLIYPWLGAGFERLAATSAGSKRHFFLTSSLIIFLILTALSKNIYYVIKQDRSILEAAEWLKAYAGAKRMKLATNDPRIAFHAGRYDWVQLDLDIQNRKTKIDGLKITHHEGQPWLLVLRAKAREREAIEKILQNHRLMSLFEGRKYAVAMILMVPKVIAK